MSKEIEFCVVVLIESKA